MPDARGGHMKASFKYTVIVGVLGLIAAPLIAEDNGAAAAAALKKAGVNERLVGRTAPHPSKTGTAPSFVVDPGWPKTLPNNWIIGDIGGLFVDKRDHIWVYHRPRALAATAR